MKCLIKARRASGQRGLEQQRLGERTQESWQTHSSPPPPPRLLLLSAVSGLRTSSGKNNNSFRPSQLAISSTGPFPLALIKFALKTIRFEFVALVLFGQKVLVIAEHPVVWQASRAVAGRLLRPVLRYRNILRYIRRSDARRDLDGEAPSSQVD